MSIEYRRVAEGDFICIYGLKPGVYRVRFTDEFEGWAHFYLNGKKVWDCNDDFARAHTAAAEKPKKKGRTS